MSTYCEENANSFYSLTPLQRKVLQIISDAEKDPASLHIKETDGDEFEIVTGYFKMLLIERNRLQQYGKVGFAVNLIEEEIFRLFMAPINISDFKMLEQCTYSNANEIIQNQSGDLGSFTDSNESIHSDTEEVTVSTSVLIPVAAYPSYNFIGRIIGPRGMTNKQLEKETGCRIMVRGQYLNKTYGHACSHSKKGFENESVDSPLRVVIQTRGPRRIANARIEQALGVVSSLLVPPPDGRDELKRRQLVELAIMNGTYRSTNPPSEV